MFFHLLFQTLPFSMNLDASSFQTKTLSLSIQKYIVSYYRVELWVYVLVLYSDFLSKKMSNQSLNRIKLSSYKYSLNTYLTPVTCILWPVSQSLALLFFFRYLIDIVLVAISFLFLFISFSLFCLSFHLLYHFAPNLFYSTLFLYLISVLSHCPSVVLISHLLSFLFLMIVRLFVTLFQE